MALLVLSRLSEGTEVVAGGNGKVKLTNGTESGTLKALIRTVTGSQSVAEQVFVGYKIVMSLVVRPILEAYLSIFRLTTVVSAVPQTVATRAPYRVASMMFV
jgi:hypothetical protein